MSYKQLTQEERYQICAQKKAGHDHATIAGIIDRNPGTISWELRRNRGLKGRRLQQAHNLALRRRYDKAQPRTITCDNGREFADHEGMASDLEASNYFAHPYASWERGLSENTNGLIRQYFPKNRDLTTVTK